MYDCHRWNRHVCPFVNAINPDWIRPLVSASEQFFLAPTGAFYLMMQERIYLARRSSEWNRGELITNSVLTIERELQIVYFQVFQPVTTYMLCLTLIVRLEA